MIIVSLILNYLVCDFLYFPLHNVWETSLFFNYISHHPLVSQLELPLVRSTLANFGCCLLVEF